MVNEDGPRIAPERADASQETASIAKPKSHKSKRLCWRVRWSEKRSNDEIFVQQDVESKLLSRDRRLLTKSVKSKVGITPAESPPAKKAQSRKEKAIETYE